MLMYLFCAASVIQLLTSFSSPGLYEGGRLFWPVGAVSVHGKIRDEHIVADIDTQVRALEKMDLEGLRDLWRAKWGAPPKMRSAQLLRLLSAWRIQAAVEGGLDIRTKAKLRSKTMPRIPNSPAGTRMTREYQGVLHTVEIGDGVVQYAGRTFRSLSAVANQITGTHWNGPRFFGLRRGRWP